jgi:hypothetical protein
MVERTSPQNHQVQSFLFVRFKVNILTYRAFRDKRFQIIRHIWDIAAQELGIPSVPRGGGDEGVIEWREQTTEAWEYFQTKTVQGDLYHAGISAIAELSYQRMIKPFKQHSLLEIQEHCTVEFEAWVILVLLTTWKSPSSQHSEKNCWGTAWIKTCSLVERQRLNRDEEDE